MRNMPPEQVRLVEALLAVPSEWTLEAEWQRRSAAVDAIIAYCGYEEGGPLAGRPRRSVSVGEEEEEDKATQGADEVQLEDPRDLSVSGQKREPAKPTTYFQCGKTYSQYQGLLWHSRPTHLNDRKCKFYEGWNFSWRCTGSATSRTSTVSKT